MKAAVVSSFDTPPRYAEFALPAPTGAETVVDVIAAGLHPRVRSQVDGSHYTSTDDLPLVPGIDGVGRGPDGRLRYFVLPDTTMGSMAERTVVDPRRAVLLPESSDPIAVAAAMNPAMSSWVALRRRIELEQGQNVLVLGATGSAGQLAVQVARLFGAGQIVAVARGGERLDGLRDLGATHTVSLDGDPDTVGARLAEAASEVDVVLDYLWGEPAARAMTAVVMGRTDRGEPLSWVQIGSVAGATAAIPSAALRAARLQIVGSGQGSVSPADILGELPALAAEITRGTFTVSPRPLPLAMVAKAWSEARSSRERIVLVP